MKKTNSYTINHQDRTITITKRFANASSIVSIKEYRELTKLHKDFPEYTIQRRTATITAGKRTHSSLTLSFIKSTCTCLWTVRRLSRSFRRSRLTIKEG